MSVYVDPMAPCLPNPRWRHRESCHLWADSDEELHGFAESLGLLREWHQNKPGGLSHYDLTAGKRQAACRLGAVPLTREKAVSKWRESKQQTKGKEVV